MFCFGFIDESPPKKAAAEIPEFVGYICSVAAAGGEDPSLDIGIQGPDGSTAVTLRTRDLATNAMIPMSDTLLWNYLPSWFYDAKLASESIDSILKNDLQNYSVSFDFDQRTPIDQKYKPYAQTLDNQFKRGYLGRYTCRMFESPKTKDGIDVYKLVVDSCTVRFMFALVPLFLKSIVLESFGLHS